MKHKTPSASYQKQLNKRFPYSSAKDSRNDRFNKTFHSLDLIGEGDNPEKRSVLSDNGEGARKIRRAADHEDELEAAKDIEMENQRFVLLMVAAGMLALCNEERPHQTNRTTRKDQRKMSGHFGRITVCDRNCPTRNILPGRLVAGAYDKWYNVRYEK